ncbi:hypothetical protein Sar04_26020 [Salinispora arenicola]|uniref:Uncharacterized protein n=1 Tax=Salinispora arenicola TaxID=168697 RepID=A0ABQ4JSC7_SALAC|nr:hypothetical protein Sar04_26020 [Salinispora arenicola]
MLEQPGAALGGGMVSGQRDECLAQVPRRQSAPLGAQPAARPAVITDRHYRGEIKVEFWGASPECAQ